MSRQPITNYSRDCSSKSSLFASIIIKMIKVQKNVRRGCTSAFERPSPAAVGQLQSPAARETVLAVIDEFELLTERADLPSIEKRFKRKACCASFVCLVGFVVLCSATVTTATSNQRIEKYWNVRELDKVTDQYFKQRVQQANVDFFDKQATNPNIWQPIEEPSQTRVKSAEQYAAYVRKTTAFTSYSQKIDSILGVHLYDLDMVKLFLEAESQHLPTSDRFINMLSADSENLLRYNEVLVVPSLHFYLGTIGLIVLLVLIRYALKASKIVTMTHQSRIAEKLIKSDNQRLKPYGLHCLVNHELTELAFVSSSHLQVIGNQAPAQRAPQAFAHYTHHYPARSFPQTLAQY